jgi:hypothetical protein
MSEMRKFVIHYRVDLPEIIDNSVHPLEEGKTAKWKRM